MILPITYYGNPILRKRAREIENITPEIVELAHNMVETMDANNGIGLAAPQVGQDIRLFVLRNTMVTPEGQMVLIDPQFYINPKLSLLSDEVQTDSEGCLSIPGINAEVTRPLRVTVEAMDLTGQIFVETAEGYKARVIMHENDHINGVLYIDRISDKDKKRIESDLQALVSRAKEERTRAKEERT